MREIDQRAAQAAGDPQALAGLVRDYEAFILKCAAGAASRYVTKSDDEWSVAMEAFCGAVNAYAYEKGGFLPFAELLIRRRLIDYFRQEKKHQAEFSVDPSVFTGERDTDRVQPLLSAEIAAKTIHTLENPLRDEIDAAGALFARYGFSFYDLAACSPKSYKTKAACRAAVSVLLSSPVLCLELRRTGNLPLKPLEKNAGVPRKVLERHRKYIIAAVEILSGDYPGLAVYLQSVREGDGE